MTFEEHLENHRREDGSYDIAAAEAARADEIRESYTDNDLDRLAEKAARDERRAWERTTRGNLHKQMLQPALSPELELDAKVQIGESTARRYGDMDELRIRMRMDLRTKVHMDENEAFNAEQRHWLDTLNLLDEGETISQAMGRGT